MMRIYYASKRTDLDTKPGSQNNKCLHSSTKLEMNLLLPTFRNNKGIERLKMVWKGTFMLPRLILLSSNGNNKTISVSHLQFTEIGEACIWIITTVDSSSLRDLYQNRGEYLLVTQYSYFLQDILGFFYELKWYQILYYATIKTIYFPPSIITKIIPNLGAYW